jgi:hypothetical protein
MDAAISASALRSWMQANRWDARDSATNEAPTSKGHPYGSPLSWGSSATGGVNLAGWSKLRFQDVYEAGQKVSLKELESTHISTVPQSSVLILLFYSDLGINEFSKITK